jgi:hypothetical protein
MVTTCRRGTGLISIVSLAGGDRHLALGLSATALKWARRRVSWLQPSMTAHMGMFEVKGQV